MSLVMVRAEDSGEATLKQLIIEGRRKHLKTLSPELPERNIQRDSRPSICGIVVFKGEII